MIRARASRWSRRPAVEYTKPPVGDGASVAVGIDFPAIAAETPLASDR